MLGAGGIVRIILSTCFGRAPVLFWILSFTISTAVWCGVATSFECYMTARIVNGFFSTVGQAVRLCTSLTTFIAYKSTTGRLDVH